MQLVTLLPIASIDLSVRIMYVRVFVCPYDTLVVGNIMVGDKSAIFYPDLSHVKAIQWHIQLNITSVNTGGSIFTFDWYFYIWPWPITKVNQGHAHFYCEYHLNGLGKYYCYHQIENHMLSSYLHISCFHLTVSHANDHYQGLAYFDCEHSLPYICNRNIW